jgi:serine protease Do
MNRSRISRAVTTRRASPTAALAMTALAGALLSLPALDINAATTPSTEAAVGSAPPSTPRQSFADLVERVKPAVVNISTKTTVQQQPQFRLPPGSPFERQFREFFEKQGPGREAMGMGSGFIIDSAGYVVTNNHVIDKADEVTVTLHDGSQLTATVVGRDDKTDLALLKVVTDRPLVAVRFGDSDAARVGDWVLAVGNPFGLGGTVTAGIISARGRDIRSGPFDDFLQVDAPINRGNSGGPLFDDSGQVIGVNTAIFSPSGGSVGIGFAIPAEMAARVVAQLKDRGRVERGWMGVVIQPLDDALASSFGLDEARGALVSRVNDGSPAQRAGLEPGDVILGFDGEEVDAVRTLPRIVARTPAGKTVPVELWRNGESMKLSLRVGRMPGSDDAVTLASAQQRGDDGGARLGVALAPLDGDGRRSAGLEDGEGGVLVQGVQPDGPAARRGVRPGDVILRVGKQPVSKPEEVEKAVRLARGTAGDGSVSKSGAVVLLLRRDGSDRFVAVPFEKG